MKTFFEKTEIKPNKICYFLKYNKPIKDYSFSEVHFKKIKHYFNGNQVNKLKNIINNVEYFDISGFDLKYLPSNINNPSLVLNVYYYNEIYFFPENWNIKKLDFYFSKSSPLIPNSFICEEIGYSQSQKEGKK